MNYKDFQTELTKYIDDEYCEFTKKLVPSERPFLGVRIPDIRKVVKEIPKNDLENFIDHKPEAFEEILARGIAISRLPYDKALKYFDSQIELIDDWSTCDTFCAAMRSVIKKHKEEFLDKKIEKLLKSKKTFSVRVGLVFLLNSFVEEQYLDLIFARIESLKNRDEYYIKMAIAWLLVECFIKFPEKTKAYLLKSTLPKWTFNKAISKICDSFRVEKNVKTYLKTIKK